MASIDQQLNQMHEEVAAKLDQANPTSWIPEKPGDEIVGTLVGWQRLADREGHDHNVAVIDTGKEHKSVWLLHATLKSEVAKVRPEPGEFLGVRYLGKRESATTGRTYHAYKVVVHRPVPADNYTPDFDGMLDSADEELGERVSDLPLEES